MTDKQLELLTEIRDSLRAAKPVLSSVADQEKLQAGVYPSTESLAEWLRAISYSLDIANRYLNRICDELDEMRGR